MSIRTRFEIETFVLGAHPTPGRKAQALMSDLLQASAEHHPDLPVPEQVYDASAQANTLEERVAKNQTEAEQYWIQRI